MYPILSLCLLFIAGTTASLQVPYDYHLKVGIPAARRIKEAEDKILSEKNTVVADYRRPCFAQNYRASTVFTVYLVTLGQSNSNSPNRIVGGDIAPVHEHPFLAGLVIYFHNHPGTSVCGSSLISADRLITSAHCWDTGNYLARQFLVILGSRYLFSGGNRIATNNVILHPQWRRQYLKNNIAIIYLPIKVPFSFAIRPIALPESSDMASSSEGQLATAAGYGQITDAQAGISVNTIINYVRLSIISNAVCQRSYGENFVRPDVMCTDGSGGVGICGGDSGSPLFIRNGMGEEVLVGVGSFSANNACQHGHPSGFARVTSFMDFIRQHM